MWQDFARFFIMSEINIAELSDEDLLAEVIRLKNISETNQRTLADMKQLENEAKREHSKQQRLLEDSISELDRLQNKNNTLSSLNEEILALEGLLEDTNQRNNVEFEDLQRISERGMLELEKLQEEMNKIEDDVNDESNHSANLDDTTFRKHVLLKEEYDSIQEQLGKAQQRMSGMFNEKQICADEMINIQQDIDEYEEKNRSAETSLQEERALVETLTGELALLRIELQSLQRAHCVANSNSYDENNSNSLFSEVDERRVLLQDQVMRLKTAYGKLKDERQQLNRTLEYRKIENAKLRYICEDSLKERDMDLLHLALAKRHAIDNLNTVLMQLTELYNLRTSLAHPSNKSAELNSVFENVSKLTNKINEFQTLLNTEDHANYTTTRTIQKCKYDINALKKKAASFEEAYKEVKILVETLEHMEVDEPKCICKIESAKKRSQSHLDGK